MEKSPSFLFFMLIFGYVALGLYVCFKGTVSILENDSFKRKHLLAVLVFPLQAIAVTILYFFLYLIIYIKEQGIKIEFLEKDVFKKRID